ncbi:MAG: type II toxin-antitoxin system RelE/ParE family toxin [Syntrophobacteraceae bacterium]
MCLLRYSDKIISRINLLSESLQIGRAGRVAGTRELVIAGTAYVVPYRVSGGVVQILRVYHTSRLWPDSFK